MRLLFTMLALALLTAGFLWPVEDAVNGSGLHLVILWLMLGSLDSLRCWRADVGDNDVDSVRARFGLIDTGILLIAIGHILSTAVVFQVEGDRRAALNLTFEWIGLFVAFRVFRSLTSARFLAAQTVRVIIAIAVGLAAFGIWQHHVFYPEQAAWYRGQRAELDEALNQPNGAGLMRVAEIVSQFQSQGIPLEGTDQILWENRLLSSSEPFATFSLANTLAGILATSLVLLAGHSTRIWDVAARRKTLTLGNLLLQLGLLAYCLILTKSRSAWAGAVTGFIILAFVRSRTASAMKVLRWGLGTVCAAGAVAGAAAFLGALDKEVILEAPRSLQFRLFYWAGAASVLNDHPLAGAGPGNFRQLYLQYKADESSEEIRDPHNFFLEAWSAGGLVGVSGLILFLWTIFRRLGASASDEPLAPRSDLIGKRWRRIVPWAMISGFALHAGWGWINGGSLAESGPNRLLLLTGLFLCVFGNNQRQFALDRTSCLAASVAMIVNLLAAGGFEMPAVMLLLLVCGALGVSRDLEASASSMPQKLRAQPWGSMAAAATCLCAAIVVLKFGLIPVSTTQRHLSLGDDLMHRQRNPRAALVSYDDAAKSDPLAVTPRHRIAELETHRLRESISLNARENLATERIASADAESPARVQELLPKALAACDLLISADRRSSLGFRMRADCLAIGAGVLDNTKMLMEAVEDQRRVVEIYPSSADDWVRLVRICSEDPVGRWDDLSKMAAERAITLDRINHQWGHRDRYLSDSSIRLLKSAAAATEP